MIKTVLELVGYDDYSVHNALQISHEDDLHEVAAVMVKHKGGDPMIVRSTLDAIDNERSTYSTSITI